MNNVKESLKSFAGHMLSLMRSAKWDIAAVVRSMEGPVDDIFDNVELTQTYADHAIESYVSLKLFQGFENESSYTDDNLTSLLDPTKFWRDCLSYKYRLKSMEPSELLDLLPTCHFGKFCCKKYLATVPSKMEDSLFKNLDQRKQVLAGNHPTTELYGGVHEVGHCSVATSSACFLFGAATPKYFQANQAADYHSDSMESVVKHPAGHVNGRQVVGFYCYS